MYNDRREKQRRLNIRRLSRELETQIQNAADLTERQRHENRLQKLKDRWACGLNSENAKTLRQRNHTPYFAE